MLSTTKSTTEEAAVDIAAFAAIFFEHFKRFTGKPFHMAGESYGVSCAIAHSLSYSDLTSFAQGRYLPLFASAVLDQNARLVEYGIPPVNLASVMIGTGADSPLINSV